MNTSRQKINATVRQKWLVPIRGEIRSILVELVVILSIISCDRNQMETGHTKPKSVSDIPERAWKKLATQKIYFGHQSVGHNLMNGVTDVMNRRTGAKLRIVEGTDASQFREGAWLHSTIGNNQDPISKIRDFEKYINSGIGDLADIVFMKLCYVDILENTDIQPIFKLYKETIARLLDRYSKVKFVHFTVPLMTVDMSLTSRIKGFIGKPIGGALGNIKRAQYAQLVREEYGGKSSVFDIAKIESTYPDGRRHTFSHGGKTYYSLIPEYTNDGGHLNWQAAEMGAAELISFLSAL